jgi:hypothetical protein
VKHSFFRGHPIIFIDHWVYEDTKTRAGFGFEVRPCKKCGRVFDGSNKGEPDPCLGLLPGVNNACCGHGVKSEAYIRFENGVTMSGFECLQHTAVVQKGN